MTHLWSNNLSQKLIKTLVSLATLISINFLVIGLLFVKDEYYIFLDSAQLPFQSSLLLMVAGLTFIECVSYLLIKTIQEFI